MVDDPQPMDRQERARCPEHGLALRDDGTCLRCQRPAAVERSLPSWLVVVVGCGVAMAALAGYALLRSDGEAVTPTAELSGDGATDPPIDREAKPRRKARKRRAAAASAEDRDDSDETDDSAGESGDTDESDASDEAAAPNEADRKLAVQREMRRIPIKMYTTSWCPHCKRARVWLQANQFSFREYDVEHDTRARDERNRLNPRKSVPTFDIDGRVTLVGFSQGRMRTTLEKLADERVP